MSEPATVELDQRGRILDNALELMSAQGAAGTSMRQLASACGLNVATIYHYFPSKAELLRSVIAERRYGERIATDLPPIDPALPARTRLVALVSWLWRMALDEQDVWRLIVGESMRGDEVALATAEGLVRALDTGLEQWLRELFPELSAGDGEATARYARVVRGQLFSFVVEHLAVGGAAGEIDARAADLAAVLFPGPDAPS